MYGEYDSARSHTSSQDEDSGSFGYSYLTRPIEKRTSRLGKRGNRLQMSLNTKQHSLTETDELSNDDSNSHTGPVQFSSISKINNLQNYHVGNDFCKIDHNTCDEVDSHTSPAAFKSVNTIHTVSSIHTEKTTTSDLVITGRKSSVVQPQKLSLDYWFPESNTPIKSLFSDTEGKRDVFKNVTGEEKSSSVLQNVINFGGIHRTPGHRVINSLFGSHVTTASNYGVNTQHEKENVISKLFNAPNPFNIFNNDAIDSNEPKVSSQPLYVRGQNYCKDPKFVTEYTDKPQNIDLSSVYNSKSECKYNNDNFLLEGISYLDTPPLNLSNHKLVSNNNDNFHSDKPLDLKVVHPQKDKLFDKNSYKCNTALMDLEQSDQVVNIGNEFKNSGETVLEFDKNSQRGITGNVNTTNQQLITSDVDYDFNTKLENSDKNSVEQNYFKINLTDDSCKRWDVVKSDEYVESKYLQNDRKIGISNKKESPVKPSHSLVISSVNNCNEDNNSRISGTCGSDDKICIPNKDLVGTKIILKNSPDIIAKCDNYSKDTNISCINSNNISPKLVNGPNVSSKILNEQSKTPISYASAVSMKPPSHQSNASVDSVLERKPCLMGPPPPVSSTNMFLKPTLPPLVSHSRSNNVSKNQHSSIRLNHNKPKDENVLEFISSREIIYVKDKSYIVLKTIGKGGSSEVFLVIEPYSVKLMAVKCVDLRIVDKIIADGYLNEVALLSKLQGCESVIRMFDHEYVEEAKMLYVVMENGDTDLSKLLRDISKTKNNSMMMIMYYWTEMLTAVKDIHDRGIIHSDLKPANFLLVCGRLKLIDFGIASSLQGDMTSVHKEVTTGTWNYMSPEAIKNGSNSKGYKISYKSDVWSLGCILYNLVYGKTPFSHIRNTWSKLMAIADSSCVIKFPEETESMNRIPPVLLKVMQVCLTRDPKLRPSVQELLNYDYNLIGAPV